MSQMSNIIIRNFLGQPIQYFHTSALGNCDVLGLKISTAAKVFCATCATHLNKRKDWKKKMSNSP